MSLNYSTICVNGEVLNCMNNMSLIDLLTYLDFDIKSIIVEYNSEIIAYNQMFNIILRSDDIIEILTIVGGG